MVSSSLMSKHLILLIIVATVVAISGAVKKDKTQKLTNEENCLRFSVPSDREFTTPLYPNLYPNNTECVLRLNADFGFLIKIDFRDYFEIEPSEGCQNDYLEIRDGPHGYSDLIGRFCGGKFPPIIVSKDKHLWLRFATDDTLQYKGFRAVYEFIKNTQINRPEIDVCAFNKTGVEGLITHADIPEFRLNYSLTYSVSLECIWYIEVAPHQKIYMFFEEFNLAEPNECDRNYVDIFGDRRDVRFRMKHFCGSVADPVVTTGNKMYFRYFAVKDTIHSEFRAWFTAFRDRMQDHSSKCEKQEFDCDDARCIDSSLRCNGIKNCEREHDEKGCNVKQKKKFDIRSEHIIITLTLGCGLLAGIFLAACYDCIRKLIKDGRQIHENIRRSREQLEEGHSESLASSPKMCSRGGKLGGEEGMRNPPTDEDTEVEEEEEDDEEEEEEERRASGGGETKDCECLSRSSHGDSGHHGTPPPPPPPSKRPPSIPPPLSPVLSVPTPPPPPVAHSSYFSRHHPSCQVSYSDFPSTQDVVHYDDNTSGCPEAPRHKHRTEALHAPHRPSFEVKKGQKTTPDVLVIH